jgi:hypothetical protein
MLRATTHACRAPLLLCRQVCNYIDMPLQHISNLTLLAMNRPPQAHTKQLLRKLRDGIPGLALRTTFITGAPRSSRPCAVLQRACCTPVSACPAATACRAHSVVLPPLMCCVRARLPR